MRGRAHFRANNVYFIVLAATRGNRLYGDAPGECSEQCERPRQRSGTILYGNNSVL